ncbi:hypothetical protein OH76DRAFT_204266 [Lentinus brumalis]|uniref:Uncharacterized protein n=1 Tax=Lentinus brumalis TaxID=2498619 RepID=A0A371DID6_9APHY|nr:hypothetical protein OH76DRAFT_204266 [Polyporus brumalis]
MSKVCSECHAEKTLDAFSIRKKDSDGGRKGELTAKCTDCMKKGWEINVKCGRWNLNSGASPVLARKLTDPGKQCPQAPGSAWGCPIRIDVRVLDCSRARSSI